MSNNTAIIIENIRKEYTGKVIPCHWETITERDGTQAEHIRLSVDLGVSLKTLKKYVALEHSVEPLGYIIAD